MSEGIGREAAEQMVAIAAGGFCGLLMACLVGWALLRIAERMDWI